MVSNKVASGESAKVKLHQRRSQEVVLQSVAGRVAQERIPSYITVGKSTDTEAGRTVSFKHATAFSNEFSH